MDTKRTNSPGCPAILKSGKRIGNPCGRPSVYGRYCSRHKSLYFEETISDSAKRIDVENLIDSAAEASKLARIELLIFLIVGVYLAIIVATTTDLDLFRGRGLKLPFFDVTFPIIVVYVVGPIAIVVIHLSLLLRFYLVSDRVSALASLVNEGELRARLHPLAFGHYLIRHEHPWGIRVALLASTNLLVVVLPTILMLAILVKFSAYQDEKVTLIHHVLTAIVMLQAGYFFPKYSLKPKTDAAARRSFIRRALFASSLVFILLLVIRVPGGIVDKYTSKILTSPPLFFDEIMIGRLDLRQSNFREVSERSLQGRYFRHAMFPQGVDFGGYDFRGSDFSGASLPGANFRGSRIVGVNFTGANLSKSDFSLMDLRDVNFAGVNLFGASLFGTNMREGIAQCVDFGETDLRGSFLNVGDFSGSYFHDADMLGAQVEGATITAASFRGADLRATSFRSTSLRHSLLFDIKFGRLTQDSLDEFMSKFKTLAPDVKHKSHPIYRRLAIQSGNLSPFRMADIPHYNASIFITKDVGPLFDGTLVSAGTLTIHQGFDSSSNQEYYDYGDLFKTWPNGVRRASTIEEKVGKRRQEIHLNLVNKKTGCASGIIRQFLRIYGNERAKIFKEYWPVLRDAGGMVFLDIGERESLTRYLEYVAQNIVEESASNTNSVNVRSRQ